MLDSFTGAFNFLAQCRRGIDGYGLGGPVPHRYICLGVAHIGKALWPEPLLKELPLAIALHVQLAIRTMCFIEYAQMGGDRFCEIMVAGCHKRRLATGLAPGLNECDHCGIIREGVGVD